MDETELFAQGWRRCAIGQKTTQWCAQAEEQRRRDEELLQKALEALEEARHALYEGHPVRMNTQKAIAALRERLGKGEHQ